MRRRTLLRTGGIALAGVGAATTAGTAAAGDADPRPRHEEGRLPNDNVETQQVDPLTGPGQSHEAPVGTWIKHSLAWGTSDCETARALVESTRDVVHIAGERIEDTQRFWGPCDPSHPTGAAVDWTYYTPPKPPGTYDFSWRIEFTDDAGRFEAGTVLGPFSEPYEVVAGRGGGGDTSGVEATTGAGHGTAAADVTTDDCPRPL